MKDAALGNAKDPAKGTKGRAMPCVGTSGYWFYFIPIDAKDGATDMGLSENSVPLNPMVNDHYPY